MKKTVIPAIIAESQRELDERIGRVIGCARLLQLDVMDGEFVPSHSLDFHLSLPEGPGYEAHLMVARPCEWIERNLDRIVTVLAHIESLEKPEELVEWIRGRARIGFALNPETPIEKIEPYLEDLDQVLVMTVTPGFYGSKFLPEMLEKVRRLREMRPELDIEVDGGVTADTIRRVDEAGANMFVSGSHIMKAEDPSRAMEGLIRLIGGEVDGECTRTCTDG